MTKGTLQPGRLALASILIGLVGVATVTCTNAAQVESNGTMTQRKLEDTPTLNVRGEATLEKPADQIGLRIGVITQATEADVALEENSERMLSVVDALEHAGLTKKEFKTGRFSIQPQYTPRPRQVPPDWTPKIIGYQVQNSIEVSTKKIDAAGELIKVANQAGANSVDFTGFSLSNPRAFRTEAIQAATQNAMNDARDLASAAELRLVRIININLDSAPTPRPMGGARMMRAEMMADAAPPISGGDVPVRASVNVTYEIESID